MSFAEIRWYSTIAPNRITGPLNGVPNRLSYGDFPSDKRSWLFRRYRWHSMESAHHSLSRSDCTQHHKRPFFDSTHCSFCQSHLFLFCVALTYNDSRIIPRKTCQNFQELSVWMTFGFSRRLQGTSSGSSGSPGKFLFYIGRVVTTVLPSLVPPRHIDDCGVTHILHEELCDPQLSSRQNFPLWARLYQHVFCKNPSLFLSSSRYRFLGNSESACGHYAYPNKVPLLLATLLVIHEKNWQCLYIQAQGFPWLSRSTFIAIPASHAIDSLCTSSRSSFLFVFSVSVGLCSGFPVAPHSYFHFFRVLDVRCLVTSNTESCDQDDEEVGVGVVEEPVDKPGTTNST